MRLNLFGLLSEFTVLLLGGFLIVYAFSRPVGIPERTIVMEILGAAFIYWALRNWMRREPEAARLQTHIRAASLLIVGLLIISIPLMPLRNASLLLGFAGAVLVLRGLAFGVLSVRMRTRS